ncbi:hypothetical protein ACFE04_006216 [Oxalis oulophora]
MSEAAGEEPNAVASTSSSSSAPPPPNPAKIKAAVDSLSSILTTVPPSLSSSKNPSSTLLHDPDISSQISTLLRHPDAGAGTNNLCRWLYDTFQSTDPTLQLVVLRFLPVIAGIYLSRVPLRKPLAGFEAVLLALYAHETTARGGQPITVHVPDLAHPSIYHESKTPVLNNATGLNLAVISSSLEPHGTVRSTRRARIVGVALEFYYTKISQMPVESKIDFCEFCEIWAGEDGEMYTDDGASSNEGNRSKKEGRITLPWELVQPILRILGHCILGTNKKKGDGSQLFESGCRACRSLYARSLHDLNQKAILATGSLLRLAKIENDPKNQIDHTEIQITNLISI